MIYVFLATGFEEVEALGVVDVCRRAQLPLSIVSVTSDRVVRSAHGVGIEADFLFADASFEDADLLFLPGGMPGAENLYQHEGLREAILRHHQRGGLLGAICAAPLVYGRLGLLQGLNATCYPGFESELAGAQCTGKMVEETEQFILGKGPAAAIPTGLAIARRLAGADVADGVAKGMLFECCESCAG